MSGSMGPQDDALRPRRRFSGRRWAEQANRAVHETAQRVEDTSGESSARASEVITTSVRLLRRPTALLALLPAPFIFLTIALGLIAGGVGGTVVVVIGALLAAVSGAFALRRRQVLRAIEDPAALAAELRTMVNLTGRVEQGSDVLRDIAGGGGWRVLDRMRGLWRGATLPGQWLDEIGELPRAKYFAPPKIGTTVWLAMAALWLVPISVIVAVFTSIAALAGSL